MKSQHRHDLQTNELGRVADKIAVSAEGFFETYGNRLMIGFCAVSLVAAIVIYKVRRDHARDEAAWRDLSSARRAEDFAGVSERHPGTSAALWARLQEGEGRLNEGVQLLFTNVESGRSELEKSRKVLQSLVDDTGAPAEIRERALLGLAVCLESLSDGTEADAVKTYQALVREFPASIYKKQAESRIAALNSGSGQEFYAWFAKYERPKPAEKRPRDRAPGESGADSDPLMIEGPGDDKAPGESLETPEDAPLSAPGSTEKPAAETPAAEKPAEESPAKESQDKTSDAAPEKQVESPTKPE